MITGGGAHNHVLMKQLEKQLYGTRMDAPFSTDAKKPSHLPYWPINVWRATEPISGIRHPTCRQLAWERSVCLLNIYDFVRTDP